MGIDLNYVFHLQQLLEELEAEKAAKIKTQEAQAEAALDDLLEGVSHNATGKTEQPVTESLTSASTSKKRTREEILKGLQAGRASQDKTSAKDEDTALPTSKFRKIGAAPITDDSNRPKKKKRRKLEPAVHASEVQLSAPSSATAKVSEPAEHLIIPSPTHVEEPQAPLSQPTQHPQNDLVTQPPPGLPSDDNDDDIFADAGDYRAFDDNDDDEASDADMPNANENGNTQPDIAASDRPQLNYFDHDSDDEADPLPLVPLPSVQVQKEPDSIESKEEKDSNQSSLRLSGFEDGTTDIKALLAADKAAEKEEKRKERKERWRAKQGGASAGLGTGEITEPFSKKKKLTDVSLFKCF